MSDQISDMLDGAIKVIREAVSMDEQSANGLSAIRDNILQKLQNMSGNDAASLFFYSFLYVRIVEVKHKAAGAGLTHPLKVSESNGKKITVEYRDAKATISRDGASVYLRINANQSPIEMSSEGVDLAVKKITQHVVGLSL